MTMPFVNAIMSHEDLLRTSSDSFSLKDMEENVMLKSPLTLLCDLFLCIVLVSSVFALSDEKRGNDPQCQNECLRYHSEKMSFLSQEYLRTQNKANYQDQVERELLNYSRCLSNCRERVPIK